MPRKLRAERKEQLADPKREVWTVPDVAAYLRISEDSVRDYAKAGKLPGLQLGSLWRFSSRKVRALLVPE